MQRLWQRFLGLAFYNSPECLHVLFPQKELYEQYSESVESADLKSESEVHVFQSLQFLRKVCLNTSSGSSQTLSIIKKY